MDQNPPEFDIGWLSWKDLVAAIEQSPGADERWFDFLLFLEEERVAWRSLPADLGDPRPYLKVLIDVNLQVRARWPNSPLDYKGNDPALLQKLALAEITHSGRLTVTAGPLAYGLVPIEKEWCWWIAMRSKNFQGVPLNAAEIVDHANHVGLSDRWRRTGTPHTSLETCAPIRGIKTHEDAVSWFGAALDELRVKGILQTYIDGVAAKSGFGKS